jgi:hypothetical protein
MSPKTSGSSSTGKSRNRRRGKNSNNADSNKADSIAIMQLRWSSHCSRDWKTFKWSKK